MSADKLCGPKGLPPHRVALLPASKLVSALSLIVLAGVTACGASAADTPNSAAGCNNSGCFSDDASVDSGTSDVSTDIGNNDSSEVAPPINPLCGVVDCVPDEPGACGSAGAIPDAGDDDAGLSDAAAAPTEAGSDAAYNKAPKPFDGYPAPPVPDPDASFEPAGGACQVTANASGLPVARCAVSGTGFDSDPCVSSADCAPGFACVGDEVTGLCRPYCCNGVDSCPDATWCAERTSRDALTNKPSVQLKVPVCVPGEQCVLLPKPDEVTCPEGLVCTVARNDGTLACLPPGTLGEGDTCNSEELRCAEGFVCSGTTMTCLKLCRTDSDVCGSGVCQAGSTGLPENIGICVGNRD